MILRETDVLAVHREVRIRIRVLTESRHDANSLSVLDHRLQVDN